MSSATLRRRNVVNNDDNGNSSNGDSNSSVLNQSEAERVVKQHEGRKSKCVAYLLWLLGGTLGLHLLYLHRDRQAVVWIVTLGGYWLGWLTDMGRISEYVDDYNNDPARVTVMRAKMAVYKRPRPSMTRSVGMLLFASTAGYMFRNALHIAETPVVVQALVYAVGIAVGAWTVAGIGGRQYSPFKPLLVVSLLATLGSTIAIIVGMHGEHPSVLWFGEVAPDAKDANKIIVHYGVVPSIARLVSIFAVTIAAYVTHRWTPDAVYVKRRGCCSRMVRLFVVLSIAALMVGSNVYFNAEVEYEGRKVPVHQAVRNMLESKEFQQFFQHVKAMYRETLENGWEAAWESFARDMDMGGDRKALRVLRLDENASWADVRKAYRRLSLELHPDKRKGDEHELERQANDALFIQVQKAYEHLKRTYKHRKNEKKQTKHTKQRKTTRRKR